MYEFTKKDIRKKFKETSYGKKTNRYLLIGAVLFLISLIMSVILSFYVDNSFTIDVFYDDMITFNLNWICYLSYLITAIFIIILVYLDGKRDGAIRQFEQCYNKNN